MTNKDVLIAELSSFDDDKLFKVFCDTHDDDCGGCSFLGQYCPISSTPTLVSDTGWMNREYTGNAKTNDGYINVAVTLKM